MQLVRLGVYYLIIFFNVKFLQVIAGVLESVSVCLCILVVLKLGLKINLVIYMLVAGISCLMVNFIADGNNVGVIALAMIGMCFCYNLTTIYMMYCMYTEYIIFIYYIVKEVL